MSQDVHRFASAVELLNRGIRDSHGEFVGWVRELLLDLREGRIAYVRIELRFDSARGLWTLVVPWSAVRYEHDDDSWRVVARKATLTRLARSDVPTSSLCAPQSSN